MTRSHNRRILPTAASATLFALCPLTLATLLCAQDAPAPTSPEVEPAPTAPWTTFGLDRSIDWFALEPDRWVDARRPKRSIDTEVDRGALLDDAIARAKEQGRLVFWYVPRIVEDSSKGRQMYRAPVLDMYAWQVFFNDPEVAALLATRFVPVRLACDETLCERFGIRPLEFIEPAFVVVDGEGNVVHQCERIRTFDSAWMDAQLRLCLPEGTPSRDRPAETPDHEAVEALLARGKLEHAAKAAWWASEPDAFICGSAKALFAFRDRLTLLSRVALRRSGRLAEIGDRPLRYAPTGDRHAEQNRVALLTGRPEDVSAPEALEGDRSAEAVYLAAVAAWQLHDSKRATVLLRRVLAEYPDSMFAARARANLELGDDQRPYGALFSGYEHFGPLEDAAYRQLANSTVDRDGAASLDVAAATAVRNLLQLQRANGGFEDSRYAYWPSPEITPNAWVAISALAATALHTWRDVAPTTIHPETIDAAIDRAEAYLFDPLHMNRGANEDVYADTYRLLFLVRRHSEETDEAERTELIAKMNAVVQDAADRQSDDGFWAHEYRNAFCTAAMLHGLGRAREAGATIPDELMSRGASALVAARTEEGGFAYGGTAEQRHSSIKDSSARMPSCEGILFALGQSDEAKLVAAYDAFWEHMDRIEQVRRNDFHSDGELAGFFFFHALFHATEIADVLPEAKRREHGERTLALLRRIPEIDGCYLDSHEIGRSYGTAMALLCIDAARRLGE